MSKDTRPRPGTPEFRSWLLEDGKKFVDKLFSAEKPEGFEEDGYIAGPTKGEKLTPEKSAAEDAAIDKAQKRAHLKVEK
ncbi:hypothetical protein DU002_13245 [Corallincola holothuriorum]|uniref:Uncharacterized protein n=1 Tax=Corallincola holothuriorum TaxID=2282215 RepID=A0A368NGB3_9GAMM|nr:hypothetical protein [Corallincola holothuriorum]RCU48755.1 hypothetical protein DU002_13245 [Corallincola holothuriorum]